MTDKEKLEKLFTKFGIEYSEYFKGNRDIMRLEAGDYGIEGNGYALFEFSSDGNFIVMEIWE